MLKFPAVLKEILLVIVGIFFIYGINAFFSDIKVGIYDWKDVLFRSILTVFFIYLLWYLIKYMIKKSIKP